MKASQVHRSHSTRILTSLAEKLHPKRFAKMSGRMVELMIKTPFASIWNHRHQVQQERVRGDQPKFPAASGCTTSPCFG